MPGARPASRLSRAAGAVTIRAATLVARAYRLYHRTFRYHGMLPDGTVIHRYTEYPVAREIVALCERDALALGGFVADRGYLALVTPGRDGDWAAAILEALGCRIVRGASGRGGVSAGMELTRLLQGDPAPAAVVVDGPLGPTARPKPGVLLCAQHSARPVRPIAAAVRYAVVFGRTWSKLYLPLPFSRLVVAVEEHVVVAGSTADRSQATELLTTRLERARQRALRAAGAG